MLPPWSRSTIYQIFPLSFYDSNNDGKGDLKGIIQKLDYIAELGFDTIWLNPIYASTWIDAGYDITNHTEIDPIFGIMKDLDDLIKAAHKRKLKIMLDLLPNHTSDQHPWFIESSQSKDNIKRDWYTWQDPSPDGGPPNNWKSVFGGSAWTFDATTSQYYLHTFYPQQPDLNLSNPNVRKAIYSIMKFYLGRGVDAFRIDAASHFAKDPELRNNPLKENRQQIVDPYEQQKHLYDKNRDERFEIINEFSHMLEEYPHAFMITESYLDITQLQKLHSSTTSYNHTACNFHLVETELNAKELSSWINTYLHMCEKKQAVPTWIISNHDRTRIASRIGHQKARLLAMLQMTLPGISFTYYGDEIGMTEYEVPTSLRHDQYEFHQRDAQRTPMQWDQTKNSGFSSGKPWLPVNPNATIINVQSEEAISTSTLHFYKEILTIRKDIYNYPDTAKLTAKNNIISYQRGKYIIILNMSETEIQLSAHYQVVLSTYCNKKGEDANALRPYEGIIASN